MTSRTFIHNQQAVLMHRLALSIVCWPGFLEKTFFYLQSSGIGNSVTSFHSVPSILASIIILLNAWDNFNSWLNSCRSFFICLDICLSSSKLVKWCMVLFSVIAGDSFTVFVVRCLINTVFVTEVLNSYQCLFSSETLSATGTLLLVLSLLLLLFSGLGCWWDCNWCFCLLCFASWLHISLNLASVHNYIMSNWMNTSTLIINMTITPLA